MLIKVKTMIAVTVLSVLIGANAHAATIQVKKGDTLWALSRVHKTTVGKIKQWNHLHTDLIHPGDVLNVSPEASYTVMAGDTLWAISRAHHIHVSQLMERNSLTSDLIHPGLILVIPESTTTSNVPAKSANVTEKSSKLVALSSSYAKVLTAPKPVERATRVESVKAAAPQSGRVLFVTATAYTSSCAGCSGVTATGINVASNPNARVIAVDPSVIPLGSKVYIEGLGEYTAADTGGAIKGNRIDIFMPSEQAALDFGRKQLKLTVLQ